MKFKVVDLFAGPGGLAEGLSAVRGADGERIFEMALSVEMDKAAFRTLRMRSFIRQFPEGPPPEYYDYISGKLSVTQLVRRYRSTWKAACRETLRLELGKEGSEKRLTPKLDAIAKDLADGIILVGGPPCQAYSLVGRARNRGNAGYDPLMDRRYFLYEEYLKVLRHLRPIAFVMENVKGLLSARAGNERVLDGVLQGLRDAGGTTDSYELYALSGRLPDRGREFVLRAEDYGVPQRRHRLIIVGFQSGITTLDPALQPQGLRLQPSDRPTTTVHDVLLDMPRLRSALSRGREDSWSSWRTEVARQLQRAAEATLAEVAEGRSGAEELSPVASLLTGIASDLQRDNEMLPTSSTAPGGVGDSKLAEWLLDPHLLALPNHEARSHMPEDLARYAFAAAFAEIHDRSPKSDRFPRGLAPAHQNWESGKFADRFRVQCFGDAATTVTSHIAKDGHYFIHPDPTQCRSLTVREAARLQTFPDNYLFEGNRTQQFSQVGNAVPPLLAYKIGETLRDALLPTFSENNQSVTVQD